MKSLLFVAVALMFGVLLSGCTTTCIYTPREPEQVFGNSFPRFTDELPMLTAEEIASDPFLK